EQDVRLRDLDIVALRVGGREGLHRADALVVVVDGHRESALGGLLADDVLLEEGEDLLRLREVELARRLFARLGETLLDDLVAQLDALVADVDARTRDELLHLLLALATEGALQQVGALTDACHCRSPSEAVSRA